MPAGPCARLMHCHHEKLVIVDDEIAFVGGIDLTTLAGDRYDTNEHAFKADAIGWHDAQPRCCAARSCVTSPRTSPCAGRRPPARRWSSPPRIERDAGDTTVQFTRTVPEGAYKVLPRGEFSVLETTSARSVGAAPDLPREPVPWSPEIVRILETKLRNPPSPDFRVVVLLPHKANNSQDDTRGMLGRLVEADDGRKQFLAATIMSRTG